jgi:predicted Zn-ribbon and HTH transcriptional regulator
VELSLALRRETRAEIEGEEGWRMATVNVETFRCMACGHEYEEKVEKGDDKERTCPKCRSNSIRHLRKKKESVN